VQLALLVYELVKQVEEARFVVVADVLDVPLNRAGESGGSTS